MFRVSIFGVGAIGGVVAASLSNEKETAIHLHVRGAWGSHLMLNGIHIEGEASMIVPPKRFDFTFHEQPYPQVMESSSDVAIICSKATDIEALLPLVRRTLKPEGIVCILSNGLGLIEISRRYLPVETLVYSSITHGAFRDEHSIIWAGKGGIQIEHPDQVHYNTILEHLIDLFKSAGLNPIIKDNGRAIVWDKALLNIAINPIAALTGKKNGELLQPNLFQNCMHLFKEASTLASYEGVDVMDEFQFEPRLQEVLSLTSENQCSMLQDIQFGRETEIDFLNGKVVELAEKHGLSLPRNALITDLIRSIHPTKSVLK